MDYRSATLGRVFAVRFDHGDDVLAGIEDLARREGVRAAFFHLLGGLARAEVVTGPREPVVPPEPVWAQLDTPHEVVGMGSLFWDGDTPRIHCHTVFGHHGDTLCACLRRGTRVYLVVEAYLVEMQGLAASRPWFPEGGFHRLTFGDEGEN